MPLQHMHTSCTYPRTWLPNVADMQPGSKCILAGLNASDHSWSDSCTVRRLRAGSTARCHIRLHAPLHACRPAQDGAVTSDRPRRWGRAAPIVKAQCQGRGWLGLQASRLAPWRSSGTTVAHASASQPHRHSRGASGRRSSGLRSAGPRSCMTTEGVSSTAPSQACTA